jgi:predicted transcriptional regulator
MEQRLNSDIFLSTFNELEKHFKNELFHGSWKSFKQMLKEGSRFNPIIKQFKEELFEFTDLRNAIVHNASNDYQVIAEPHSFVVEQFIEIKNQIINPIRMDAFFKKVYTCKITDPVSVPLEFIHKHLISQVPVLDNKNHVIEVLNAGTIANWLAAKQKVSIATNLVAEVLELKEFKRNFEIIPASTSVFHAAEIFKNSYKKIPVSRYYDAVLISSNGQPSEEIKGIIVLSDIAEYL